MKSRGSYKLSTNDDWVEESWTVDCVCGVNFDDGEEMVNCDDCGVWVHTRCSHYVKSEKSFACDKCKNRKTRNNSEETEVAQLLVELPTKTLRMENPTSYGGLPSATTLAPAHVRPCRSWIDIPLKERVHMQGIPGVGDDPGLFSGVSSVFSPQLWKCAGYVPKKFNFSYKECPHWEEDEAEADLQKKNGVVSLNVGVLVSSNSEIPSDHHPEDDAEGVKTKNRGAVGHDKLKIPELAPPKLDNTVVSEVSKPYLGIRKDQSLLQSSRVQCGKRKENYGMLKDSRTGKKKKARTMENQGEFKKKNIHFLGPASTKSRDVRKLQWHEERGHGAQKDESQGNRISKSSDTIPVDHHSNDHGSSKNRVTDQSLDASIDHSTTRKEITKEGKSASSGPEKSEDLSKTILSNAALSKHRDSCGVSSEGQVASNSDVNTGKFEGRLPTGVRINSNKSEIVSKDVAINHTKVQGDAVNKVVQDNCELNLQPSPVVVYKSKNREMQTQSEKKIRADCPINSARVSDAAFTVLEPCTPAGNVNGGVKIENNCQRDDVSSPVADHQQSRIHKGSSEDILGAKNNSSKEFESKKISDEPLLKSSGSICGPSKATNGDSSYEDSAGKLKKISESKDNGNNNNAVNEVVKGEGGSPDSRPKILLTKLIRSSHGSITKSTQTTKKVFPSSNSKKTLTDDSREPSTLSHVPTLSASPQHADANSLQPEIASDVEKKVNGSVLSQKVEKTNQPLPPMSSSKVNTSLAQVATSSNSPAATLTDEELALLLHQELNSSPRVPRVPRMRHAGSLPQLSSPTASSMMKRTSTASGKEHGLAPRRREKEYPKDGLRDGDEENKTTEWTQSSLSDQAGGGQDSGWTVKDISNGSATKGGVVRIKSSTSSSPVVEATEHPSFAVNRPPRNPSDDSMCTAPRTLPGLIAEIMSKGQRMTYEELCNTVLPHWPNLRKHNGERYAYSSHSQAVLDCLRTRNKWAQLVDRGSKQTSVGRKRRKPVSDHLPELDSEDNDDDNRDKTGKNQRGSKSVTSSHHEEFPKGNNNNKREARKWSQKGRGVGASGRSNSRRRIEEFSDDEADSYMSSSDEEDDDASLSEEDDAIRDGVITPGGGDGAKVSKRSSDAI